MANGDEPIFERHYSLKPLAEAIKGCREQEVFEVLAMRLELSSARRKRVKEAIESGWCLEDAINAAGGRLNWRKEGGRPKGSPVNGEKIRECRNKIGMTQEQLALHCRLDVRVIQRGERGGPWSRGTLETVATIFTQLGVNVEFSELLRNPA